MPPTYQQVAANIESVLFDLIDPNDDAALEQIRTRLKQGWGLIDIFQVVEDYKNGALGGGGGVTLTTSVNAAVTVIQTSSSSWLPTPFDIVIDDERMTVTSRAGSALTVTRGVSSTAAAHTSGAIIVTVPVAPVTAVKVPGGSNLTGVATVPVAQTVAGGGLPGLITSAEKDRLAAIADQATKNQADSVTNELDPTTRGVAWTGKLPANLVKDEPGTQDAAAKVFTYAERQKLSGIAASATANQADSTTNNLDRRTGTGAWTGQLDAGLIKDEAATTDTAGRKFTKAHADKITGFPTLNPGESVLKNTDLSGHVDKNDGTRQHYSTAINIPNIEWEPDGFLAGQDIPADAAPVTTWASGNAKVWAETVTEALGINAIVRQIHINNTINPHNIVVADLMKKDANGVYTITKATTPPSGNPPADSTFMWQNASKGVVFRNEDGDEVILTPTWRNEVSYLDADHAGVANTTLTTILETGTLPAGAIYSVTAHIIYSGISGATGGIQFGWSASTGSSRTMNWSALMLPANGATITATRVGDVIWRHNSIGGVIAGNCAGAGNKVVSVINGLWRVGATAATAQLKYAQVATHATPTIVHADSWLRFERVG